MMQKSWHNLPNLRLCWLIILIISFELYRFLEREMSKIRLFEMEFHVFFHRSYLVKSDNLWSNWIHQKVFHANLRSLKNINFLQNISSRIFLCCFSSNEKINIWRHLLEPREPHHILDYMLRVLVRFVHKWALN